MVEMLNQTLADATDLMTQVKVAHWNVKGMNFYQLHLLFDEIAETLEAHIDIVAERATSLGGEATGSVRVAAAESCIPEIPSDATTGREYVAALVERVGIHANNLRGDIEAAVTHDDEDTADLYTELSRAVDQQLYFLEAHLQTVEPDAIPDSPGGSVQTGQSHGSSPSQYRRSQMRQRQSQQGQMQGRQTQRGQSQQRQTRRGQMQGGQSRQRQTRQGRMQEGQMQANPRQYGRSSQRQGYSRRQQ
jgi:starvation-inducible DNA-binding protein